MKQKDLEIELGKPYFVIVFFYNTHKVDVAAKVTFLETTRKLDSDNSEEATEYKEAKAHVEKVFYTYDEFSLGKKNTIIVSLNEYVADNLIFKDKSKFKKELAKYLIFE